MFVQYTAEFPAPFPSQKRYLLPNQDYGAFKSINLVNPKIEVTSIEVVSEKGDRRSGW